MAVLTVPDDYATVQEALAAAVANDLILIRSGEHTEYFTVTKQNLEVEGESGAIIKNPANAQVNTVHIRGSNNILLRNLISDANKAENPYLGTFNRQNAFWIENSYAVTLEDIIGKNAPRGGLEIQNQSGQGGGHKVTVRRFKMINCAWNGITLVPKEPAEEYLIENGEVYGCSDVGVTTYDGSGVHIKNVVSHDNMANEHEGVNTHAGFGVEANSETVVAGTGTLFELCEAYGNYAAFYHLLGSIGAASIVTLKQCNFHDNGYGLRWSGGSYGLLIVEYSRIVANQYDLAIFSNNAKFILRFCEINSFWFRNAHADCLVHHCNINNPSILLQNNTAIKWDDGEIGNYWGDYTAKYPNAQVLPNGTWDTPYVIDANNVDNHPLVNPVDITPPDEPPPPPTQYTLTIQPPVNGTTSPTGTVTLDSGLSIGVQAIPDANYELDFWELDGNNLGKGSPILILFDADHTLLAHFKVTGEPPPPQTVAARSYGGLGLPAVVLDKLWRLRERFIKPEIHKKIHPII